MSELIWISDWQIQCCGSEFAVGDSVTWPVFAPGGNRGGLAIEGITGVYDSHEDEPLPMMSGVVRRIQTVRITDTSVVGLDDINVTDRWFGGDAEREFVGWLVDLEVKLD